MSTTSQTIQQLTDFRTQLNQTLATREIVTFNPDKLDITNDKISYDGSELSKSAQKKMLSTFRVKNSFLDIRKSLNPGDWNTVKEKLKLASASRTVHGRKVLIDNVSTIDDIYLASPKNTNVVEIDVIFQEVVESILNTSKDLTLKEAHFYTDVDQVGLTFVENDREYDVFGTQLDMWKTGERIVWNGMNFTISPFFERLACSNGNTVLQHGFRSNISNSKFNLGKIRKVLEKELTLNSENAEKLLIDSTNHLKCFNVSVYEYLKYKNFFNENDHKLILDKWFDDQPIRKAFTYNLEDMPHAWQRTADTGKNAYDFFNDLTYIASHPTEAILTPRERADLQIKSSDLLFQKVLDLENLAPKTSVQWI